MERLTLNDNERLSRLNVPFLSFFSEEKTEENVRCEKRKRERRGTDSFVSDCDPLSSISSTDFQLWRELRDITEMEKIGR